MRFDYNAAAADADELLTESGQACVLGSVTTDAYDPAESEAVVTNAAHPVTAAILAYPQHFIDGSLILAGDKRALVSPVGLTVTPKPGDTLTDAAGAEYKVIDAKELAPAGTVVLWTLQVRK